MNAVQVPAETLRSDCQKCTDAPSAKLEVKKVPQEASEPEVEENFDAGEEPDLARTGAPEEVDVNDSQNLQKSGEPEPEQPEIESFALPKVAFEQRVYRSQQREEEARAAEERAKAEEAERERQHEQELERQREFQRQ